MIPLREDFDINKTLEKIQKRFYWVTCKQDVDWCENCKICIARKGSDKEKSALQIFNSRVPIEKVQMGILGQLPTSSSGNKYLLVIMDCFTKWVEALSNVRSKTIAEIMVKQIISRFGVPLELHTNQGKNFETKMFQELIQLLEIKKTTTPFHPQSNRQVECQHQMLLDYLVKFISKNQ